MRKGDVTLHKVARQGFSYEVTFKWSCPYKVREQAMQIAGEDCRGTENTPCKGLGY